MSTAMRVGMAAAAGRRPAAAAASGAGREAVLKQIDLPHSYYWRELYLPQLTTGPSSLSFTPDGASLVYSMAGSLWLQRLDGDQATRADPREGRLRLPARCRPRRPQRGVRALRRQAPENCGGSTWRADANRRSRRRARSTSSRGSRRMARQLAWVSTEGTGHFNLFVADIDAGGLHDARPLLGERKSAIDRYYYSAFDHAVNPSWSPDGATPLFRQQSARSPGAPAMSGRFRSAIRANARESSARKRPGARVRRLRPTASACSTAAIAASSAHQLWLSTTDGAAPLPLTFGDSDRRNARWSPDGRRIAYIGNAHGNTELVLMDVIGGASRTMTAARRKYRAPRGQLVLDVVDENRPARLRPGLAWSPAMAAPMRRTAPGCRPTTASTARVQSSETHYFHCAPPCLLELPPGNVEVTVQHGFAHAIWQRLRDALAKAKMTRAAGATRGAGACRPNSASGSAPTCTCT